MNARLLYILLLISVVLIFTRRFRRVGIVLSAVLVALIIWVGIDPRQRMVDPHQAHSSQPSSHAAIPHLSIESVELIDPQLAGNGAPWQLTGKVRNNGDAVLNQFTLRVTRLDCPDAHTASADCTLNWQAERTVHLRLAQRATGALNEAIWSHDPAPRIAGVERVDFIVLAVHASAADHS